MAAFWNLLEPLVRASSVSLGSILDVRGLAECTVHPSDRKLKAVVQGLFDVRRALIRRVPSLFVGADSIPQVLVDRDQYNFWSLD